MRVSVRSPDARRARALQEALSGAGLDARASLGPASARGQPVDDVAIIDAEPDYRDWTVAEARRLGSGPSRPLTIVAASSAPPDGVDSVDALDGWIQLGAPEGLVGRRLNEIVRQSALRRELDIRRATMSQLGVALQDETPPSPWRALFIGEPGPFYLAQERAIAKLGGSLEAAFSSFMGFDFLHERSFDAVTLNAVKDNTTALALCGALRRNARLHNLPTAVIVRDGDVDAVRGAVERGAALIVDADAPPEHALAWLFELMRRARRNAETEMRLVAARAACGGSAGLFSASFFHSHVTRLAESAHAGARPLTLVALRMTPAAGARAPAADLWSRAVADISGIAARLVRVNDTAALVDNDTIVAALPDAARKDGRRMAERVAGVVECTAFASGENGMGPIVLAHSVAELAPGESGAALLARVLDGLQPESARA